MTFRVTVFETALPDFGVTVTVTLHDPAFTPFTEVPLTLQYLAEDAATLTETRDPEATVMPAYLAIAVAVAAFLVVTAGAAGALATGLPEPLAARATVVAGAVVAAGVVAAVVCGATVPWGGAVVGAAVVGAAVVGAAVVGAAVVGAAVVAGAARVTANV